MLFAAMETFLRLTFRDVHSLYHALFIVGPLANLTEVYFHRRRARSAITENVPHESPKPFVKNSELLCKNVRSDNRMLGNIGE